VREKIVNLENVFTQFLFDLNRDAKQARDTRVLQGLWLKIRGLPILVIGRSIVVLGIRV
jgi:hypothetical protein